MVDLRRFVALTCVVLSAAAALAGCASAPSYRFVDPAQQDMRYDGFLAYGAFADVAIEAAFEQALCDRLFAAGHACTSMLAAAPPTRQQDAASRHAASRASGAQATIVIELADMHTTSRRVIGHGRVAYNVRVIDNAGQQVTAQFAFDSASGARQSVATQADELARRIVSALKKESLLHQR